MSVATADTCHGQAVARDEAVRPGHRPEGSSRPTHGGFGPQLVWQSGSMTRVTFGPTVAAATLRVVSPPDSTLTRTAVSVKYEPGA